MNLQDENSLSRGKFIIKMKIYQEDENFSYRWMWIIKIKTEVEDENSSTKIKICH